MNPIILKKRYELQNELGKGAFATVYLAHDRLLDRPVAIKQMHEFLLGWGDGKAIIGQFQKEAQAIARLNHSHTAHIYDIGNDNQMLYLVLEYLPGGDLAQQMAEHAPYTLAETVAILAPIAEALEAAHAAGMIHRDVKPQNILFRGDNRPVLTDFGLVKFAQQSITHFQLSANMTLGTSGYMAPEQIDETLGETSPATDTFALAVIACEMLTGKTAFIGSTPEARNYQTIHGDRPKLLAALPDIIPPAIRQAIQAGLIVEPVTRPTTPVAFITSLFPPLAAPHTPQKSNFLEKLNFLPTDANPAGIEWIEIPAGEFVYGDKKERHYIRKSFKISKYPVTNVQYKLFIDANPDYAVPHHWDVNKRTYSVQEGNWPVVNVSYNDALVFCGWAGCRLPNDVEWEKAACGDDGRIYPWGEDWVNGKYCNSSESGIEKTTEVDEFIEGISPYGVWDMAGNVWEWIYRRRHRNTRPLRGGSWNYDKEATHIAYRRNVKPVHHDNSLGIRCVQD